jgi:hypothetical protein
VSVTAFTLNPYKSAEAAKFLDGQVPSFETARRFGWAGGAPAQLELAD